MITDSSRVRDAPVIAALALIGHPTNEAAQRVAVEVHHHLLKYSPDVAPVYADVVLTGLPAKYHARLEEKMLNIEGYVWQTEVGKRAWAEGLAEGVAKGLAEGLAEGKAEGLAEGRIEGLVQGKTEGLAEGKRESLLRLLDNRNVDVPEGARKHISTCTDLATLDRWMDRALDMNSIDEILG